MSFQTWTLLGFARRRWNRYKLYFYVFLSFMIGYTYHAISSSGPEVTAESILFQHYQEHHTSPVWASVIVPVFDGKTMHLSQCLSSIVAQTLKSFEIVVVDCTSERLLPNLSSIGNSENTSSTSPTSDVEKSVLTETTTTSSGSSVLMTNPDSVESIVEKFKDQEGLTIKTVKHKTQNAPSARNFGISKSEGEWILNVDADDTLNAKFLERAFRAHTNNPSINLIVPDVRGFGSRRYSWSPRRFSDRRQLLYGNAFHPSSIFKRRLWVAAQGYNEAAFFGWEDYLLWLSADRNLAVVPHNLWEAMVYSRYEGDPEHTICTSDLSEDCMALIRTAFPFSFTSKEVVASLNTLAKSKILSKNKDKLLSTLEAHGRLRPVLFVWEGLRRETEGDSTGALAVYEEMMKSSEYSPFVWEANHRRSVVLGIEVPPPLDFKTFSDVNDSKSFV